MEDLKYIPAKKQTLVNIKVQTNAGKNEVGEDVKKEDVIPALPYVIPAPTLTSFPRRRESRNHLDLF